MIYLPRLVIMPTLTHHTVNLKAGQVRAEHYGQVEMSELTKRP